MLQEPNRTPIEVLAARMELYGMHEGETVNGVSRVALRELRKRGIGFTQRDRRRADDRAWKLQQIRKQDLVSATELMRKYKCSRQTIVSWASKNCVAPVFKLDGVPMYRRSDFASITFQKRKSKRERERERKMERKRQIIRKKDLVSATELMAHHRCSRTTIWEFAVQHGVKRVLNVHRVPMYRRSDFANITIGHRPYRITAPDGRVFDSLTEACRSKGVSVKTIERRLQRRGVPRTAENAAKMLYCWEPKRGGKGGWSLIGFAVANGVPYASLHRWLQLWKLPQTEDGCRAAIEQHRQWKQNRERAA